MRSRFAVVLAAALCAAAWTQARAETLGWYAGGEAGWSKMADPSVSDALGDSGTGNANDGFSVGGFGGYNFGMFKLEGELNYRQQGANRLSSSLGSAPLSGNVGAFAFMANGIYNIFQHSVWTPYIGIGVGGANLSYNGISADGVKLVDNSDLVFAYQAIAGVSYALTPQVSVGLDYRYFSTVDPSFATVGGIGGGQIKSEYHTHNILLNVVYHFGAPPPPPPPVPAAMQVPPAQAAPPPEAQAQTFVVFFDFNKSTLTPEGAKVLDRAVIVIKTTGAARIQVTGYTDTVGSVRYNLALSQRRAQAVHDYLVQHGVPDGSMSLAGRGKENLRVPTADGVREAQNRRVEIVF